MVHLTVKNDYVIREVSLPCEANVILQAERDSRYFQVILIGTVALPGEYEIFRSDLPLDYPQKASFNYSVNLLWLFVYLVFPLVLYHLYISVLHVRNSNFNIRTEAFTMLVD